MNRLNFASPRVDLQRFLWLSALLVPALMSGQVADSPEQASKADAGGARRTVDAWVDASYTGGGSTKFLGVKREKSDAFSLGLGIGGRVSLGEGWMVPLGLQSQNLTMNSLAGTPVPDHVHTLGFSTGLGRRLNDRWTISATVSPTLYKLEDIRSNDIGVSGGLTAIWNSSPKLTWAFGLLMNPDSDVPVLPVVGLIWRMNDRFDLSLVYPKPRLTYRIDDRWRLYAGVNVNAMTFRSKDGLGDSIALPAYNDALGTYRDIRLGAGLGFKITETLSVEAEGGSSIHRQIDYTRIDERVKFDSAAYVRVGLAAAF